MLKSASMKRFYMATPTKYEDKIIESLGALGSAQLISDYTIKGFKRVDNVEKAEKYIKLQQRIVSILSTLPPEKVAKKSFLESLKESFGRPISKEVPAEATLEEVESYVSKTEAELDEKLGRLEKSRSEQGKLKGLEESLLILQKHGLGVDSLGGFEYVFVKAGFMNKALSPKLQRYVEGTSVKYTRWPEKREEDFIVILGLNRDKPHIEEALTLLNFAELTFPKEISSDPKKAIEENRVSVAQIEKEIREVEKDVRNMGGEFQKKSVNFEPVVRRALMVEEARSTFSRTETVSLAHGWIPSDQQETLRKTFETSTNGAAFLKFEDPRTDDEPPVRLRNPSIVRSYELLTRLKGIPGYQELDPTPIIAVLFTIMYGMMFGDVGNGLGLLVMGVVFSRLQRSFLKIPSGGMRRLGVILTVCGVSSIVFGFLYGEFFLYEAFHPLVISPIHDQSTIIILALLFGVVQLIMGLILKIVNLMRRKATYETAFAGVRLIYYLAGVGLAIKYVENMTFEVFIDNLWLTAVALATLILLFLSPTIESILKHEFKLVERLMMGVSEFIETFLSFLTNSISYVRLAAFAIAHSALGLSAAILAETMGILPSYIVMNILVMTIEALAVLIQCMRLTYYEFFTKFYAGNGLSYRPFSLPRIYGRIK